MSIRPDPVRIQVAIRLKKAAKVTHAFLRAVVERWAEDGYLPPGIEITLVRWLNPVRVDKSLARWKSSKDEGQSLEEARTTLRGLLRHVPLTFVLPKLPKALKASEVEITKVTRWKSSAHPRDSKGRFKRKPKKKRDSIQHVRKNKGVR